MLKKYSVKDYDFKLILFVTALNIIGILAVGSADASYQSKQILGSILGFFMMIVVSLFDYTVISKFYWLWYVVDLALLGAVLIAGSSSNNATRWFEIAGIRFQPSETAKILLIIFFAQFIMRYKDKVNSFKFLISFVTLAIVPLVLIYEQPDLSTTIVLFIIIGVILIVGGLSWKIILSAGLVAIPSAIVFLSIILKEDQNLINDYQRKRILSFFYPERFVDDAYQQANSVIAIGSGQLTGKGLNNNVIGSLKNGNFIIEPQTDFIFAVIGEEMGFVGTMAVILLLALIVIECLLIARRSSDMLGRLISVGMAVLLGIQAFFNIGVATFLLPNTGLTLPFVSYGLTSLVSLYIGLGFVLNVRLKSGGNKERRGTFSKLEGL
ncbi:MAG: rod shape-determining protein RodA [Lachnospiraceae bacterium]|nr:rod shape-determining protein RodA [Lachnospiraceae bacterium]